MTLQGERLGVPTAAHEAEEGPVVLVVGDVGREPQRIAAGSESFAFVSIDQVDEGLVQGLNPDMVLSPLVTGSFDCIDLATILSAAGYCGAYRAVAPDLPSPAVIRREIRMLCPSLDFDIIRAANLPLN